MIKLKNKLWLIILLLIFAIIGAVIFFSNYFSGSDSDDIGYSVSRTGPTEEEINPSYDSNASQNDNVLNDNTLNDNDSDKNNSDNDKDDNKENDKDKNDDKPKTEKKISSFTTRIYTFDSSRQHNIGITCNTLNNTIVKDGDTFSFTSTVGQSSPSKGYRKADIFDRYRK